jgi:hypothetical protein
MLTLDEVLRDFREPSDCRSSLAWACHDDHYVFCLHDEEHFPHDYNSSKVPKYERCSIDFRDMLTQLLNSVDE